MRRAGGLRRRLLAGIGVLTVLVLAVLAVMLTALHDLRTTDESAQRQAAVVIAASRTQVAHAGFDAAQRRARGGDRAAARARDRALARLRERLGALERTLAGHDDPQAVALHAYADEIRRHVAVVGAPRITRATRVAEARHAERIADELDALVEQLRSTLFERRRETGQLARLAEVVGGVGIAATLLIVAGSILYMRRSVLLPLRRVAAAARALESGDLGARVAGDHGGSGEVAELAQRFDTMAASLEASRSALQRQNAELETRRAELVDAVRAARESASVLRAVLDATPDAIALLDGDGAPIVDNPPMRAVRAAFGRGATAIDVRGELVPLDADARHAAAAGEELRDEITLVGTRRAFARYAAPVRDGHGRLIGRLLALREVTGEREAERAKEEFFALVSHELRTPLTAVLGYVELVLAEGDETLGSEQRRHLEIVERNAQRLLRLVGDLLFAAQLEAGSLLLEPGTVDLAEIARDAVVAARPRAEAAGVALETRIEPVEPCVGDHDRLAQVLDNLLSNALKFTPADGLVRVALRQHGEIALLEVADTGVGIPVDEQARLFRRFFRASNATERAVPGVGLGLMIVRAIVTAHGGAIDVASEVGAGTTFTVRLPLRPPPAEVEEVRVPLIAYREERSPLRSGRSTGGR